MKRGILILVFAMFYVGTGAFAQDIVPRMIGGTDAQTGSNPYMVSIHFLSSNGEHGCGGSLIAPNWVLTAAHCVDDEVASGITVYTGLYQQTDLSPATIIPVERFIQHPLYDAEQITNDVALLELQYDAFESPVVLNAGGTLPEVGFALGWGLTSVDGENSDILQYLDLPLISNEACNSVYQPMDTTILDNQICAGYYEGGKDTCQNDSGGPLLINTDSGDQLVGIVSFGASPDGTPCAGANSYGVYSRVSSFLDFVLQYVPNFQSAQAGASPSDPASEQSGATLGSDLTLRVPSILWSSDTEISLNATFTYIPGTEFSFVVSDYGTIDSQQSYAATLSNGLELYIPNVTLWDNNNIWVRMHFDPSSTDSLVFIVDEFGFN